VFSGLSLTKTLGPVDKDHSVYSLLIFLKNSGLLFARLLDSLGSFSKSYNPNLNKKKFVEFKQSEIYNYT